MKGRKKMTKLITANLTTGAETMMKIFSLAKRKGIKVVDLSITDIGEDNYELKLYYKDMGANNFEYSVYNIEGVYNIEKFN